MTEHPIIFSGEMIRAILANKKTQTRRVIKPQPDGNEHLHLAAWDVPIGMFQFADSTGPIYPEIKCPYGVPGDRLWVRETFVLEKWFMEFGDPVIPTDRPSKYYESDPTNEFNNSYWEFPHYQATDPSPELCYEDDYGDTGEPTCKWRPSIFMPRWVSRISLEITGVRVERVQEISENDAFDEGITDTVFWTPKELENRPFEEKWWDDFHFISHYPQMVYSKLWDSINTKRGYSWESNPWVWVIEFKRVEP